MSLVDKLSAAVRENRVLYVSSQMVAYPKPGILYWVNEPSKLDIIHERYYDRAILEPIQYGLRLNKELTMHSVFNRQFDAFRFTCSGAKICQNGECNENKNENWISSSARREKCYRCKKEISKTMPCPAVFYYLVEQSAEEKIQLLYCDKEHSHGYVTPHKIPAWIEDEIMNLARTTSITAGEIHRGKGTKFNFFAYCPALANLDKVDKLLNKARKSSIGVLHGARSCPSESISAIRAIVAKNEAELKKSKYYFVVRYL